MGEEKKEMYCSKCGSEHEINAKFCTNCGNPLNEAVPADVAETEEIVNSLRETGNNNDYYQQTPYYEQKTVPVKESNGNIGFAIASMICGILSLLCCCLTGINAVFAIAAIILGIVSIYNKYDGRGMAIAGIVTGCIALVFFVILIVLGSLGFFNEFLNDLMYDFY